MSQTKAQLLDGKSATIQFTGGSASTPSVSFTGDTNTGIYSPGADQVAISTGGSGRLFVDANGNVGVGATPDGLLSLIGANSNTPRLRIQHPINDRDAAISTYFDGGGTYLLTGSNHYLNSAGSNTKFDVSSGSAAWYLDGSGIGIFYNSSGSGAISERLRITSAGLVGIGTSAPSTLLHIQSTDPAFRFKRSDAGTDAYGELTADTSGLVTMKCDPANAAAGSGFRITVDNSEALRVDSSGRVGIGTSSPSNLLNVEGSGTTAIAQVVNTSSFTGGTNFTNPHFTLRSGNDTTGNVTRLSLLVGTGGQTYIESLLEDGATVAASTVFRNRGADGVAERMRITSTGRVGIGTTSPGAKLDVSGTGATTARVTTVSSGNAGYEFLNSGANSAYIELDRSTGGMAFGIGANEAARFDGSRRLLVGTSSSSAEAKFIVQGGATAAGGAINIQRNATTASAGSTIGFINFTNSANNVGATISADGDGTWSAGTSHPTRLVFFTTADGASSPTERMRIANTGKNSTYSTSDSLDIRTSLAAGTGSYLIYAAHSATGVGTGGTNSLAIYTNGNIQNTNGSYTTLSDAKLKENIVDAGSQWNDLKAIQIRNWNFKAETGHETHRQIGPIAQELETVCPGLVFEIPDRDADGNETGEVTKGVNQSVLYMKAVKALQEAMERIETLEAKVAALESA